MSVTIRLTRMGTKKKSFYRLVAEIPGFPDGRFIEVRNLRSQPESPGHQTESGEIGNLGQSRGPSLATVKSLLKKGGISIRRPRRPPRRPRRAGPRWIRRPEFGDVHFTCGNCLLDPVRLRER